MQHIVGGRARGRPRRLVAKVEWHQGELCPPVGFIVTNLCRDNEEVVKFYNGGAVDQGRQD